MNTPGPVLPPLPAAPWYKRAYRATTAHLTKILGLVGIAWTALMEINTDVVHVAALAYLPDKYARDVGIFLFALVFLRGLWVGRNYQRKEP